MPIVLIYEMANGASRNVLTVADAKNADALIAANTPAGCGYLEVPAGHVALTDLKGWEVVNGALSPISQTAAQQLAAAQQAQSSSIEAAYEHATREVPIAYMDTTFFTDDRSQFLLLGAAWGYTRAGAVPDGFTWWDSKGNAVAMTLEQLEGLAQAVLTMMQTAFTKRKQLLAAIGAATTVAEVQAVGW